MTILLAIQGRQYRDSSHFARLNKPVHRGLPLFPRYGRVYRCLFNVSIRANALVLGTTMRPLSAPSHGG